MPFRPVRPLPLDSDSEWESDREAAHTKDDPRPVAPIRPAPARHTLNTPYTAHPSPRPTEWAYPSSVVLDMLVRLLRAAHSYHLTVLITHRGRFPDSYGKTLTGLAESLTPTGASQSLREEISLNTTIWMDRCYRTRERHFASQREQLLTELGQVRCHEPRLLWDQACRQVNFTTQGGLSTSLVRHVYMMVPERFWDPLSPLRPPEPLLTFSPLKKRDRKS